ncbi:MAG: Crp/Fnr family transcriptional regulator [Terriglobia bacterium]
MQLNIVEKVIALEAVELLQALTPEQLARVAGIATEVLLEAGKPVLDGTQAGAALMVVIDGSVELSRNGEALMVAKQNDVLGAWALFDDEPIPIEGKTLEETRLLKIPREDFYDLLADNSEITQAIFSTLVKRFRKLVEQQAG